MNGIGNDMDHIFPPVDSQYGVALEDVLLAYRRTKGNSQFSLTIARMEMRSRRICCIYGTNGCGKTTLLRALAGVIRPESGAVIWSPNATPRAGKDIVLVTQAGPMPHWSVRQNILSPMMNQGMDHVAMEDRATQLIQLLGLQGLENRYAHQLSAGQQQRTILARALSVAPKVLLLDEIMSGQSEYWSARIGEFLRFYAGRGALVVMVSHDPEWVLTYGDDVINIVSDHTDDVSTTRFYIGYNGIAREWESYRAARYGRTI